MTFRLELTEDPRADQANPTSNKIYAAIGYVPVVDMGNLVVTTRAPA